MATDQFNKQAVFDWDKVSKNWIVNESKFDQDFPSKPYTDTTKPIASWIVEDIFNLDLSGFTSVGGTLPGYDIKGRDAYEMIRLSLAKGLINGNLYECYANNDGEVQFVKIGGNSASFSSNILYSVPTATYKTPCEHVMVVGYDEPPKRYSKSEHNLLTFSNKIKPVDTTFKDPDAGKYPFYHVFEEILGTDDCPYTGEGIIEYGGDPTQLKAASPKSFEDANVYDPSEFEEVANYIYKIEVPFFEQDQTEVVFTGRSVRYKEVKSMGKLQSRNFISNQNYVPQICLKGQAVQVADDVGVKIPDSDSPKFLGVKDVYVHGYRLKGIRVEEEVSSGEDGKLTFVRKAGTAFRVMLDTMIPEPIRLQQGEDYVIMPEKANATGAVAQKVVFICNVADPWLEKFGGSFANAGISTFKIEKSSIVSKDPADPSTRKVDTATGKVSGYLKDKRSRDKNQTVDSDAIYSECIFPTGEGSSGYVVKKIVVVCEWDNPSIVIRDKRPDKITTNNLKSVKASFYPIVVKDPPPPISYDGKTLNPNDIKPDYDPNSTQDFTSTEYVKAFSSLEASDVKVTMPFANATECNQIAKTIKDIQNDTADEVVYVCKPHVDVELGDSFGGGVINAIDYSYQDSNQYYISITVGPRWRGFGGSWDNSVYKMNAERLQFEGRVIKVYEDNAKCQVDVNKIGIMECINGTKHILQKGDLVGVTVYNNPVGYYSA